MHNFEIMGEAAKRLSNETREGHPEVPWTNFARFRDVLIHRYDQVVAGRRVAHCCRGAPAGNEALARRVAAA